MKTMKLRQIQLPILFGVLTIIYMVPYLEENGLVFMSSQQILIAHTSEDKVMGKKRC